MLLIYMMYIYVTCPLEDKSLCPWGSQNSWWGQQLISFMQYFTIFNGNWQNSYCQAQLGLCGTNQESGNSVIYLDYYKVYKLDEIWVE